VEALVHDILTLLDDHSAHLEFKLSDALLFNNGMVSIRDSISTQEAQSIRQKLATLGVQCELRPTLQIVPKDLDDGPAETAIYTCPACGHKQTKRKERADGRMEVCEACGIVGERYHKKQRLQQVMTVESQKHDNDRAKRIREVLEHAKLEEEALLQQEARRRLGIAEKPESIGLKIAAAVAAISIALGSVYYYNQPSPEEIALQEEEAAKAKAAKEAPAKTVNVALDKANAAAKMLEKMPVTEGANPSAELEGEVATEEELVESPVENPEERQARMTEALKTDTQQPVTPAEATEKQVKTEVSHTAMVEMEGQHLTPTRFQLSHDEHAENRHRIQQLLKLDELDLTDSVIAQTQEAYPRTLLLLDIAEWQVQHQQPDNARKTIARIHHELEQAQDTTQQALILGGISKTHLLMDEWEPAGHSLQQALEKATSLPQLPDQLGLLTRLANEQALFGNQIAARQVLELASKLSASLPEGIEPRSGSLVQIASGYAMITDFAEANKLLPKVEDPAKRQKLAEFIDKLQHRVEQVRAEYLQTAATRQP
jgi:hypothetical protein